MSRSKGGIQYPSVPLLAPTSAHHLFGVRASLIRALNGVGPAATESAAAASGVSFGVLASIIRD